MRIIRGYPPNFSRIIDRFPFVSGRHGLLFAYGDVLYNPGGGLVTPSLMAHEMAHADQQERMGRERWWFTYLESTAFRFDEELLAHRVEYASFCETFSNPGTRSSYLRRVADRLSSPLYELNVSSHEAARLISAHHV